MGAMSAVPPERLVRLLNLLEKNIRDGAKISLLGEYIFQPITKFHSAKNAKRNDRIMCGID